MFALQLDADGAGLAFSTSIGGTGDESARGVAIDPEGRIWLVGQTSSSDFPTTADALQPLPGGDADAFVTRLSFDGSDLTYSTYLGGSANDVAHAIGLGTAGAVHLAGTTTSVDFPLVNPLQGEHGGGSDGFVAKLAPDGSALLLLSAQTELAVSIPGLGWWGGMLLVLLLATVAWFAIPRLRKRTEIG